MFSKYLSHWIMFYFFVWFLGYIFNINLIVKYINPYYSSVLLLFSFILLIIYYILIKKYRYEYSYLLMKIISHIIPLLISYKLIKNKHNNSLQTLIIICIIYLIYMYYINKDIYYTYFVYKPPLNWNEYFKVCKSKEGIYIPYCVLF